jgi:iron(III) transport system substrate-binding protein
VKAHPSYSGTSLTGTYAITKVLGWDYLREAREERRAAAAVHDRAAEDIASGERAVMVDGNEYNIFIEMDAKSPVKPIYPKEGTPFVTSPTAIFAAAPHPNAARCSRTSSTPRRRSSCWWTSAARARCIPT